MHADLGWCAHGQMHLDVHACKLRLVYAWAGAPGRPCACVWMHACDGAGCRGGCAASMPGSVAGLCHQHVRPRCSTFA
eukprot:353447-Chlamydomonas_euryale.AAC.1